MHLNTALNLKCRMQKLEYEPLIIRGKFLSILKALLL